MLKNYLIQLHVYCISTTKLIIFRASRLSINKNIEMENKLHVYARENGRERVLGMHSSRIEIINAYCTSRETFIIMPNILFHLFNGSFQGGDNILMHK